MKHQLLATKKSDLSSMAVAVALGSTLVIILALSACSQEVAEVEVISSEEYARAFLAHDSVVRWEGGFGFRRVYPDGGEQWVNGQFQSNLELFITELTIDGQVILTLDDEPLGGLPINSEGACTDFFVWLEGRDQADWTTAYGSFWAEALRPGDPIVVTLYPASRQHFVAFDVPEGVNPDDLGLTLLSHAGGNDWWSYSQYREGFELWLMPLNDLRYEIFNLVTGEVYRRGELDEGEGEASSALSLRYQGGVKAIDFEDRYWASLNRQHFDARILRDDVLMPAAVYMADLSGRQAQAYVSGLTGSGRIEVRSWTEVGEMPIVAWTQSSGGSDPWGFLLPMSLYIPAGYGKVIITITGETDDWGFYFNLNLLSSGSGGPGKG